ncbi:MAG: MoxR family ATPase [Chloroflexota bacterium]|uniref:AAA+ ATPase domain-containing protein n=1 Tax=marine metagenome TaxID=408172 RepID=A0A381Q026_9ZZZZ|nr:MoxR family ATPase [Chloroflexota bacterium]
MKETQSATTIAREIVDNVSKVIVGKQPVIKQALAAVIAKGHILIEDVPGVGKTMLAKSISSSIGCSFKRIQFTPDLLPSDIVGVSIYNQSTREFQFRPGPVMAQIVLVDEINRATPKTQSALLEAMEELQVSVDGVTRPLEQPFIVMATQNPIEYEGTFPLPEAQLDRFLMRISLGYPSFTDELSVIEQQEKTHPIDELEAVASPEDVIKLQKAAQNVYVDTAVREYIVGLIEATRNHEDVFLGASPRASLGMFRAVRGMAILRDRDYAIPDDVKELAYAVLAHRLILSPAARMRGLHTEQVIDGLLESVAVPGVSR